MFLFYSILITTFYPFKSKYSINTKKVEGIVTKYQIDGNKLTINLKAKEKLIINYYLKSQEEKEYYLNNLELGDKLQIRGNFEISKNNTIPNLFNYKNYLYSNKIYFQVKANNITKIENNTSNFYYLKNKIIKKIEKIDKTGYLKTFIIGDKEDLDNNTLKN